MSLEIQQELIPLRAMAHPLRLQILSLTTGGALSAAELAQELGIAHAAASYHARQLAEAGLLQVVDDDPGERTGPGRPPVRYRYDYRRGGHLDRSAGAEALWAATAQDMQRRIRARTRHHVGADAEVWMAPGDFEEVCELAARISELMHDRARRPCAEGTVHASVSVYAFELGDGR
jgi:predicted ArsR family transcriptional regulator